jgi:gliding motility-associated-like protein
VVGARGNIYALDIQSGCTTTFVANCSEKPMSDIAVTPSGKLYLCTTDSLFMLDPANPTSCFFLGTFNAEHITGLVVGEDGNIYAAGGGLTRYDPVTQVFTFLGNFPANVYSDGDLVIYNSRMYMSASDGKIYEININNPNLSTVFYNLNVTSVWGMVVVSVKCFNDPVARSRIIAFATVNDTYSTAYMIDMENKISFPQYCQPPVAILGSADFNAASVLGGEIGINNISVKSPACNEIANGSITVTTIPSVSNIYSFSLNGQPDVNEGIFKDLAAGVYTIQIKNQFGCYIDSTINMPYPAIGCKDSLFVPTAFTPNMDGLNDVFKPISFTPLANFEMMIYNRYGQLVFRSLTVNDGWDGAFKSIRQPSGVYVWQIRYKNFLGQLKNKKGIVALIR